MEKTIKQKIIEAVTRGCRGAILISLKAKKIDGGYNTCHGRFCGYDYKNQKWIEFHFPLPL